MDKSQALASARSVVTYLESLPNDPVVVPPVIQPPVVQPPVVQPPITELPVGARCIAELEFNGRRVETVGAVGGKFLYALIRVPNPLPDGWYGRRAKVSHYEYIYGQRYRKVYLTKYPLARPPWPAYSIGSSGYINIEFGGGHFDAVQVAAGELWYVPVYFEGTLGSTLPAGVVCEFAMTLYPPQL